MNSNSTHIKEDEENEENEMVEVGHHDYPHMAFWEPKYFMKNINMHLQGSSLARYHSGFRIPEMEMFFDAGIYHLWKPNYVMVTHGHGDHSRNLNILNATGDAKAIFVPPPKEIFKNFIESYLQQNFGTNKWKMPHDRINFIEVKPYQRYPAPINGLKTEIETFKCHHAIPTIGYGIIETRKQLDRNNPWVSEYLFLKQKYSSIIEKLEKWNLWNDERNKYREKLKELNKKNGLFLKNIKKEGRWHEIETVYEKPLVCYILDTTHEAFSNPLNVRIFKYPYIITECTFIEKTEEEVQNALKKKHVHWLKLRPFVEQHPECTFILTHFSMKHKADEIIDYFKKERLPNVVVQTVKGFVDYGESDSKINMAD